MIVLGVFLLLAGVALPLAFLAWLSGRLARPPAPRPRQVGLWWALNFVLPVGLVLSALRLISPRVAAAPVIRDAAAAALAATAFLAVGIAVEMLLARRSRVTRAGQIGEDHGR
jgi:hypothetical protein